MSGQYLTAIKALLEVALAGLSLGYAISTTDLFVFTVLVFASLVFLRSFLKNVKRQSSTPNTA